MMRKFFTWLGYLFCKWGYVKPEGMLYTSVGDPLINTYGEPYALATAHAALMRRLAQHELAQESLYKDGHNWASKFREADAALVSLLGEYRAKRYTSLIRDVSTNDILTLTEMVRLLGPRANWEPAVKLLEELVKVLGERENERRIELKYE